MKESIKRILIKLHLFGLVKRVQLRLRQLRAALTAPSLRRSFQDDFETFYIRMEQLAPPSGGIVVVGILCTPHKPTLMAFLSRIQRLCPERKIILLDESTKAQAFPALIPFARLELPRSIPSRYDRFLEVSVPEEMKLLLEEKQYLREAVENLMVRHSDITLSYAQVLVCRTYQLYSRMLELWKPASVMIWSEYNALHMICTQVCRERKVEPVFMEFGVLPGTFSVECGGQMGESGPAVKAQEFLALPVDEGDLRNADEVLRYLRSSRLNRNSQPNNDDMAALRRALKPGRPVILFAGQKDFDSGMVPYTEHARSFHSPCFATSMDAQRFLAQLAAENDWNFIFKPHPGMMTRYAREEAASNTIYVDSVDLNDLIDMVDVVVTIMSQTAYVSMIRNRPVVMLGYNQLRGKGCAYEAYHTKDIEAQIRAAIENGYTPERQEQFRRHTAQLLKHYLFDDLKERPVRYGRSIG